MKKDQMQAALGGHILKKLLYDSGKQSQFPRFCIKSWKTRKSAKNSIKYCIFSRICLYKRFYTASYGWGWSGNEIPKPNRNGAMSCIDQKMVEIAGYYRNPSDPPESKSSPEKSGFFLFCLIARGNTIKRKRIDSLMKKVLLNRTNFLFW